MAQWETYDLNSAIPNPVRPLLQYVILTWAFFCTKTLLANGQDVKEMYNINNPKFVYQIVPDERRWQSQQNTFLIVFRKI